MSKIISSNLSVIDLRDYGVDLTGNTNNSSQVQDWQDDCQAEGRIASVPAGIIGLSTKVIFKAPTQGVGGSIYGQKELVGTYPVPYSMFKNLAINDGSWMIDWDTSSGVRSDGGFVKGIRFHANGLDVSLMRVRGVESTPAGFAWENFLWDDIVGYGGRVNFEHYGYAGTIRRVYSHDATMSCFRAYLCNALVVDGGWFEAGAADCWEFEVFGRSSGLYATTEGTHGIIFNQPVFQSSYGLLGGNGLRLAENVSEVRINAYFENHYPTAGGVGGISLQVGHNKVSHESLNIPTAVSITGADAPSNRPDYAAVNIDLSGSTGGSVAAGREAGARFMFNNARGIKWGRAGINGRRIEYTKFTRDIEDHPGQDLTGRESTSSTNGAYVINSRVAGDTALEVASTSGFQAGNKVIVDLDPVDGKGEIHESILASITTGPPHYLNLTDGIPTGRTITGGTSAIVSHTKLLPYYQMAPPIDPLNRGGQAPLNLMPHGNLLGSTGYTLRGVQSAFFSHTDGRMSVTSDSTVKRNGRPTLKVTRHGSVVGGSVEARFHFYPWGNERFIQTGVPIIIAGWCLVENVAPYDVADYSVAGTWDTPMMGIVFDIAGTQVNPRIGPVSILGSIPIPGHWYPFIYEFEINDPRVSKIGINIWTSGWGGYNWATDASVWYDSLGIFVNPKSYHDILAGKFGNNPGAGYFDADGKFEVRCSALPTVAGVRVEQGDRFANNTGTIGQPKAWTVTAAGPANTATFTSEGNLT